MKMTFGSDIFYNRLKQEFFSDHPDEVNALLYEMIQTKARSLFWTRPHYLEDIVQEAALRIFTRAMRGFLEKESSDNANEFSRENWLKTVVRRAGLDILAKDNAIDKNKKNREQQNKLVRKPLKKDMISLDAPLKGDDPNGATFGGTIVDTGIQDNLDQLVASEEVEEAFLKLFSLSRTKTEKLIVCAFVILVGFLNRAEGSKDLNGLVANALNGKSQSEATTAIERMLALAGISCDVLDPLKARLDETDSSGMPNGDQIIETDTRTVTHQFSSTRKQLRESSNIIPFPSKGKDGK